MMKNTFLTFSVKSFTKARQHQLYYDKEDFIAFTFCEDDFSSKTAYSLKKESIKNKNHAASCLNKHTAQAWAPSF